MNLMTNKQPEYPAPLQIEAGSSGKGSGESCGLGYDFKFCLINLNLFQTIFSLDLCCGCFECDFGCCA